MQVSSVSALGDRRPAPRLAMRPGVSQRGTALGASTNHPAGRSRPARFRGARKLRDTQWAELVARFMAGETITALAKEFNVHRTTIHAHLDHCGISRSPTQRKLTDGQVTEAAGRYRDGDSLATIGGYLGVNATTVASALRAGRKRLTPSARHVAGAARWSLARATPAMSADQPAALHSPARQAVWRGVKKARSQQLRRVERQ